MFPLFDRPLDGGLPGPLLVAGEIDKVVSPTTPTVGEPEESFVVDVIAVETLFSVAGTKAGVGLTTDGLVVEVVLLGAI